MGIRRIGKGRFSHGPYSVIDDDEHIRSMLKKYLERRGHEVATAPDGIAGLEVFRSNPADVVIVDILMPRELGTTTVLHLVGDFPGVKIIAISGGGELRAEYGLEMAARLGAQRVFQKPLNMKQLGQAIEDLADTNRRAVEELLDRYIEAILTQDPGSMFGSSVQESDVVLIDPMTEKIVTGLGALRDSGKKSVPLAVRPVKYSLVSTRTVGPVTVFAADCEVELVDRAGSNSMKFPACWSGVVENRGGESILILAHMSIPFLAECKTP